MLDKRLKLCADYVSGFGVACDVGTDHAYLAAELIRGGKCKKVIASDIKKGPLAAAANTVEKYGISDKVELVLSDGLENIPPDDVTDVVIAGMGGETIAEIIDNCPWVFSDDVSLILQPMTKAEELRKFLGKNGFAILEEEAVEEGDRVYIVILAQYNEQGFGVSEFRSIRGFVDDSDPVGRKYLANCCRSLQKKASALENAGRKELSLHYRTLAAQLLGERKSIDIKEIYEYLDSLYPFSTQEKWDNSGLLINAGREVSTVILTLDIDLAAMTCAVQNNAELVISHHPIIFEPLKKIDEYSPVYQMIKHEISAICAHTNLDKSLNGTNGVILKKLKEIFDFEDKVEIFEECREGLGFGFIVELKNQMNINDFAEKVKKIFGCEYIRRSRGGKFGIKRIAFCSGSGGSMFSTAEEKGCDVYITGDVKHDVWIEANNSIKTTILDCGHFHTENPVLEELRYVLEQKFPQLEVIISDDSIDPCMYI